MRKVYNRLFLMNICNPGRLISRCSLLIKCRFLFKERKMLKNLLLLLFPVAVSSVVHATTFDFAAVADSDASCGAAAGEYGASSIAFTVDGISVTAVGASSLDDAFFE
jgi:hypothetical protein